MIKWIDPKLRLPPQGKKILYFDKGDVYVVQRFGDYWVPIPFVDSEYAFHNAPELWAEFNFPPGYAGFCLFSFDEGKTLMTLDEAQKSNPDFYEDFMEYTKEAWEK